VTSTKWSRPLSSAALGEAGSPRGGRDAVAEGRLRTLLEKTRWNRRQVWKDEITLGHQASEVMPRLGDRPRQQARLQLLPGSGQAHPKIGGSIDDTIPDMLSEGRQVSAGSDAFAQARRANGNPVDSGTQTTSPS
jgi:hypothetical protein